MVTCIPHLKQVSPALAVRPWAGKGESRTSSPRGWVTLSRRKLRPKDSTPSIQPAPTPGSRTVSYGYDDAGRETTITYPGGSNQAAYAYDAANRLTSVTDWNSRAVAYAYDDANRMTTATLPASTGIVSSYSYDNAGGLTGVSHVQGGTTLASATYTLDSVGNRTQRVDQAGTHSYSYDNLYRLTSVTYPGPSTTSYAFDAFGNRTSKTDAGGTTGYSYDDADRLTTVTPPSPAPSVSYTSDNNGDLTARGSDSFAWDYEDRMTSATVGGTTTTFAYRGDGLRNSRTTGGVTTTFTWDVNAGLPVVLDDGNQYVYGAGLAEMVTGSGTYYYLADGLGSTMAIVDTSGTVQKSYTYDVYGKPTATGSLANEYDFAGQETDGTGLQYLRARYMDPDTGTFLSRDPLASLQGWTANAFTYAEGNPVSRVDPSGLDWCWVGACGIEAWQPPMVGGFGLCNGWVCVFIGGGAVGAGAAVIVHAETDGAGDEGETSTSAPSDGLVGEKLKKTLEGMSDKEFRGFIKSLEGEAARAGGNTRSEDDTQIILNEALRRGYTETTHPGDTWIGGSHVHLTPPVNPPFTGKPVHFPVPPGFP